MTAAVGVLLVSMQDLWVLTSETSWQSASTTATILKTGCPGPGFTLLPPSRVSSQRQRGEPVLSFVGYAPISLASIETYSRREEVLVSSPCIAAFGANVSHAQLRLASIVSTEHPKPTIDKAVLLIASTALLVSLELCRRQWV